MARLESSKFLERRGAALPRYDVTSFALPPSGGPAVEHLRRGSGGIHADKPPRRRYTVYTRMTTHCEAL